MYSRDEEKKLRIRFWELFGQRCELHPELKYRKKKWMLHRTKIKDVALRFEINRQNALVILELGNRNENLRLKAYEILERYKVVMEEGFEDGLHWEFYHQREDSEKEVCRIYTSFENADWHRQNLWPDIYHFFIENMLKLERNFLSIRDVLREELKS